MTTPNITFGPITIDSAFGGPIPPARVTGGTPLDLRWARHKDGSTTLQGAYRWTEGAKGGIEWRDIPTVDLADDAKNQA